MPIVNKIVVATDDPELQADLIKNYPETEFVFDTVNYGAILIGGPVVFDSDHFGTTSEKGDTNDTI